MDPEKFTTYTLADGTVRVLPQSAQTNRYRSSGPAA
jgi:hypothetical protein